MRDPGLTVFAKLAYAAIATEVRHGNIAFIGHRKIAGLTNISSSTAGRAVRQLIKAGHVNVLQGGKGQRNCYELASPVFAQKLRAGERVLVKDAQSGHIRNVGGEGSGSGMVSSGMVSCPRSYRPKHLSLPLTSTYR